MKTIYLNDVIIKVNTQEYSKANITLENGLIKDILITESSISDFNKADFYVTPGFVNSHVHPNQLLDRRKLDALSITLLLHQMHCDYKKTDEMRYFQALFVLIDAIKAGATSIYSVASHPFPVIKAYKTLGLKGAITCFYNDQWNEGGNAPSISSYEEIISQFDLAYRERDDNIAIHIGTASTSTASDRLLLMLNDLAIRYKTKVNIHVSEGMESVNSCLRSRNLSPIRFLESLGVLGPLWNLIHAVNIDEEEITLIAKRKSPIIHCPVSNAKTGVGIAPLKDLLYHEIIIGLGSDACSNNNTNNILNEAYFASLLHSAINKDAHLLSMQTIFKWLISNGHKIIGSGSKGSLEVGESADLLLWDLHNQAFVPKNYGRFDAALLYNAPDIKPHTVIINGNVVVKNYTFISISEEEVSYLVHEQITKQMMCTKR